MANELKSKDNIKRKVAVILGDPRLPDRVKFGGKFNPEDIEVVDVLKHSLEELSSYEFVYLDNHPTLIKDLENIQKEIDYAFNLCDEGFYNEPSREIDIPIILADLGIPYTGAGPKCMERCYDKTRIRDIAYSINVPLPRGFVYGKDKIKGEFPIIVKPAKADGGFGISEESIVSSANDRKGLEKAINSLKNKFNYNGEILIEEFLTGAEITLGIIGNFPDYTLLPMTQEDYSKLPEGLPHICGYDAKWNPESPYWQAFNPKPAQLKESTKQKIELESKKLFEHVLCKDYARFDWRLDNEGNPRLLEVNPNPGWCYDGHLAKTAGYAGISYAEMLEKILKSAEKRSNLSYYLPIRS